jgi:gentisate 1,2-dioxygenase
MDGKTMDDAGARRALKEDLARHQIHIHQPDDPPLFTRTPSSTMKPVHWRWSDLVRLLKRIGEDLDIDSGGNRRTLRLANPGLPFGTTPTFWCSIQYILPGEIGGAHRHAANAWRYIIQGNGAKSTVDGEQYAFHEGDVVLTPTWTWHDHVHEGDEPMIWLDVLDISLVRSLHAVFFEPYEQKTQPVGEHPTRTYQEYGSGLMRPVYPAPCDRRNPLLAYPYDVALPAIERAAGLPGNPFDDTALEYQNPIDGGPITSTMGARLLRLRPGFKGKPRRQTGSKVYHVIRGEGVTNVDGERFEWSKGDFISIPPWAQHASSNESTSEPALLLEVNDLPTIQALGFYREEFPERA